MKKSSSVRVKHKGQVTIPTCSAATLQEMRRVFSEHAPNQTMSAEFRISLYQRK